MAKRFRALDSGPLGLACHRPDRPDARLIYLCITVLWPAEGVTVVLPEVVDYELRRELIRNGAMNSVDRLDELRLRLTYLPINTQAMRHAAALWADARRHGHQTADDTSLDADVILAAQALEFTGEGDDLVVITENNRHLDRYVSTSAWTAFAPQQTPTS